MRTFLTALPLLLVPVAGAAQGPSEAPQPSPEQKKLGYYVGTWKSEGEVQKNPFMPAGKFISMDHCTWFDGGFAVVCHMEGSGPMGPTKGLGIMGYSTEEKAYTYYGTDSSGMTMTSVPKGKVTGDTWVYDDESMMGGKMVKSRYTMKELSPTAYTFSWQMAGENGEWMTLMEGRSEKSK